MKYRGLVLVLSLFFSLSAQGGEKRDLIMKLLDLTHAEENHELMLDSYVTQFESNPVTATEKFEIYFRDALSWDSLLEPTLKIYEELFTVQELEAVVRFYSTEEGISFINKMPILNHKSSEVVMSNINRAMHHLATER